MEGADDGEAIGRRTTRREKWGGGHDAGRLGGEWHDERGEWRTTHTRWWLTASGGGGRGCSRRPRNRTSKLYLKSCKKPLERHRSATSSRHCGGLARTLPLSTCHCVTLAFAPPSRLPWLVVALALVAPFSSCRCLSMRSPHLLPPIRLSFSLAGCRVTSQCANSASHCLSLRRCLSSTCRLVVASPLVAPPPPRVSSPHATTSRDAPAGCRVASHHAAFSFAQVRDDPQCPEAVVHADAAAVVSGAREDQ